MPRRYVARDCNAHVGHKVQDANPGPDAFLAGAGGAVSTRWRLTLRLGAGDHPLLNVAELVAGQPAPHQKAVASAWYRNTREQPLQREAGQEAEDAHGGHRHSKPQRDGSCNA